MKIPKCPQGGDENVDYFTSNDEICEFCVCVIFVVWAICDAPSLTLFLHC